jgi:O-acetyl-ADP-ribose deacetylase
MEETAMPFQTLRADIVTLGTDAIVNAANPALKAGGGVCGAIFRAAGADRLQAACDRIGGCAVGDAVITPGFLLPARYVIHTPGPVWRGGNEGEEALLSACYRRSLEVAAAHGLGSIAFPLISAGVYGYPREGALRVAQSAIAAYLKQNPAIDVTLTLYP